MNLNLNSATRIGLNVLALLGASVALYLGQSIFIPLVFSALLAVLLWPAASWLNRKLKFPWFLATITVLFGLIIVLLGTFIGFGIAIPQTLEEMPNPQKTEELERLYRKVRDSVGMFTSSNLDRVLPQEPANSTAFAYVKSFLEGGYITDQLSKILKAGAVSFFQSIIILFILLFLLLEGEFIASRIKAIFGESLVVQSQVTKALTSMADAIRSYLVWRTIVNCGLGLFLGLVYSMLELRQPWTWALFTAVLCYVPYIGTMIAGIPPVLDSMIHCEMWVPIFIILLYTIVVTVEGYLIVPLVMGRSMDLNATTVMIACLYWDLIWGISGLFLAMPLMAGIRAICMYVEGWRPWAYLMSTEEGWKEAELEAKAEALKSVKIDTDATIVMESEKKDTFPKAL